MLTKNEVGSPIPRGSGPESDAKLVGIVSLSAHIQELCVTVSLSVRLFGRMWGFRMWLSWELT